MFHCSKLCCDAVSDVDIFIAIFGWNFNFDVVDVDFLVFFGAKVLYSLWGWNGDYRVLMAVFEVWRRCLRGRKSEGVHGNKDHGGSCLDWGTRMTVMPV